jgi:hypothetical protein
MSRIVNEPADKDPVLMDYRARLEHRALWLLLLCRAAEKKGLAWEDFAPEAISENGRIDGESLIERGGPTFNGLYRLVFTPWMQRVFEMEVLEHTDTKLSINFHYCPLLKAWQRRDVQTRRWPVSAISPCAVTISSPKPTEAYSIFPAALRRAILSAN